MYAVGMYGAAAGSIAGWGGWAGMWGSVCVMGLDGGGGRGGVVNVDASGCGEGCGGVCEGS